MTKRDECWISNERQLERMIRRQYPWMEISVPMSLFQRALDKAIQSGYITFSIDIFEDDGWAAIGAMNESYHRGEA